MAYSHVEATGDETKGNPLLFTLLVDLKNRANDFSEGFWVALSYQGQYMEMPTALCSAMRSHVGCLQAEVKLKASARGCAVFEQEQENAASPFFERGRVVSECPRENQLF